MVNIKNYFDGTGELYSTTYRNDDDFFIDWINKNNKNFDICEYALDIGPGGGSFGENLFKINNSNVVLLDISSLMISKLDITKLRFVQGKIPNTPFRNNTFGIIHMSRLIHHLVGNSHKDSKKNAEDSISEINKLLKDDGLLLINEPYYDSYILDLTSYIIFYILKLISTLNIRLPIKSYQKQLLVFFYSSKELIKLINNTGFIEIYKIKKSWNNCGLFEKMCLIKDRGDFIVILQKTKIK